MTSYTMDAEYEEEQTDNVVAVILFNTLIQPYPMLCDPAFGGITENYFPGG